MRPKIRSMRLAASVESYRLCANGVSRCCWTKQSNVGHLLVEVGKRKMHQRKERGFELTG